MNLSPNNGMLGRNPNPALALRDDIVMGIQSGDVGAHWDAALCQLHRYPSDDGMVSKARAAACLAWIARGNTPPGLSRADRDSPESVSILSGYCIARAIDCDYSGTDGALDIAHRVVSQHLAARGSR